MLHRLYVNAATSVYIEAAERRQVDPLVATVAFGLKCRSSPLFTKKPEGRLKLKKCLFLCECVSVCVFVHKRCSFLTEEEEP